MFSFEFSLQRIRSLGIAALVVTALLPSPVVRAQSGDSQVGIPGGEVPLVLSGHAAAAPGSPGYHILRANTEAAKHAPLNGPVGQSKTRAATTVKPLAGLPKPGFYPADLSFFGGQPLTSASSVNIYYNCADPQSCWGNPEQFQTDLAKSKFIHVVDQYVGSKKNNRYPLSLASPVRLSGGTSTFNDAGIQNLVHQAALQVGPAHIFHVFLPQGVDVCLDANDCYSPDIPSTFVFCAYHSSVTFSDLNNAMVPYTVEPYQAVPGCALALPNPNGVVADSTNSILSHELFEAITDPFPGSNPAWMADSSLIEQGAEIGDICTPVGNDLFQFVVPSYVLVKGRTYQTQLEYSNARHGCVVAP